MFIKNLMPLFLRILSINLVCKRQPLLVEWFVRLHNLKKMPLLFIVTLQGIKKC